ncbi:MAG: flotillin-like FloA family protein, partial [Bacteroidales bacterium]|nr:flotillin-like FloA family protein [Bacteroidales bacterium]
MTPIGTYVVIIVGVIVVLWILLYLIPIGLWFQALVSGVRISLLQLIFMRWR